MASKLTYYIMSQRFQDVAGGAIEQAVARARAAGLTPAGDPTIQPSARPTTTVLVEAVPPAKPERKIAATPHRGHSSDDPNVG